MKRAIRPHIEDSKLGINPFVQSLQVRINKITMSGQYTADDEGLMLPVEIELERDASCRVYVDSVRRKQMITLTPRGKDLFLWLIYEVDNGKDWLWLNHVRYMEEGKIGSYNTYKSALNDLIKNGFIQKTVVQHVYWINPHLFFNGSRISKFPNNLVKAK